jgi:capsule biosynthesis phosphatase
MKYILLCGGIGKRCNQYSLPKPLNYINGKHLIEYIVESIPSSEIYIIYNSALDQYNFKEIVKNKYKDRRFSFSALDFLTRGAVETALVGIRMFEWSVNSIATEPIVFIDNDNIHTFPDLSKTTDHFICYGTDFVKQNYSFITIYDNRVIAIEEKAKISDYFCCGLYGFANVKDFISLANELIDRNMKTKQEFYFSQLYKLLIERGEYILPIAVSETKHLGTLPEIQQVVLSGNLGYKKMRVCFDLDNTLVSYPVVPGDYSTVLPIKRVVDLLLFFKRQGHEIIIYTARRMATHGSNVGRVMKDIAMVTFETLDRFGIPYDEIIFGKPIADIYIDDRAINPYYNDVSLFGFFGQSQEYIPNKIENNRYNHIEKHGNEIYKVGPTEFIRGELYFYQEVSKMSETICGFFPGLLGHRQIDAFSTEIMIEHVNGIPLYFLYANETLTTDILDKCFSLLDQLHKCNGCIQISEERVKQNYFDKIRERYNKNDYPFANADVVFSDLLVNLELVYEPKVVSVIHGDFWFSNILLTYQDEIKCIDMKGQVYGELTLNGDMYYDYGKMYQSILGYDLVLNGKAVCPEYKMRMCEYFLEKCRGMGLNIEYLQWVTKSLIFGTFHSLDEKVDKKRIWDWFVKL